MCRRTSGANLDERGTSGQCRWGACFVRRGVLRSQAWGPTLPPWDQIWSTARTSILSFIVAAVGLHCDHCDERTRLVRVRSSLWSHCHRG